MAMGRGTPCPVQRNVTSLLVSSKMPMTVMTPPHRIGRSIPTKMPRATETPAQTPSTGPDLENKPSHYRRSTHDASDADWYVITTSQSVTSAGVNLYDLQIDMVLERTTIALFTRADVVPAPTYRR